MSIQAYKEQPKPMKHVYQSHLPEVDQSTMALQDGRLTSVPSMITILDPSLATGTSIATLVDPTFIAASANASTNHMTVGDHATMSSVSPTVKVSDESEDFGVALTLDMNDIMTTDYVIPKIDLDIVDAVCVVTSLAIEKQANILSSIIDQVSSLAYKELHNVSHVSDIE